MDGIGHPEIRIMDNNISIVAGESPTTAGTRQTLRLRGKLIKKVRCIHANNADPTSTCGPSYFLKLEASFHARYLLAAEACRDLLSNHELDDCFWRTMILDQNSSLKFDGRASAELEHSYREWMQTMRELSEMSPSYFFFYKKVLVPWVIPVTVYTLCFAPSMLLYKFARKWPGSEAEWVLTLVEWALLG
jgi:hypothetical protein